MRVHIKSQGDPLTASITLSDGTPLEHVSEVTIHMVPGQIDVAELKFLLPTTNMFAEGTVTFEHLQELALSHGFKLYK